MVGCTVPRFCPKISKNGQLVQVNGAPLASMVSMVLGLNSQRVNTKDIINSPIWLVVVFGLWLGVGFGQTFISTLETRKYS